MCINDVTWLIEDRSTNYTSRKGQIMKRLVQVALFSLTLGIFGCAEPGHYPVSGEECGPNDPVLEMSVPDCGLTPRM